VTGWAWTFGDGGTASGATASHTYALDGTYTIGLTVTDDDGATHATTKVVTVAATPPPPPPPPPPSSIVSDTFSRTTTTGWGAADTGGSWTVSGLASLYRVQSGSGQHVLTSGGAAAQTTVATVSARDVELRTDVAWSRASAQGALYAAFAPRATTASNDYRLTIYVGSTGRPRLDLVRRVNGAQLTLASTLLSGVSISPGVSYTTAVRAVTVDGVTQLSAKLYSAGAVEPGWQVSASDATAVLQTGGRPLLWTYLSSGATAPITTSFDNLVLRAAVP
jgi:PKD repeat protein